MKSRLIRVFIHQVLIVVGGLYITTTPLILYGASPGQEEVERSLQDSLRGKVLSLRNFYIGPTLEFDSQGVVLNRPKVGPWTLYGRVDVKGVKLKSKVLEIDGQRLSLIYLIKKSAFKAIRDGKVQIRLNLDHEPNSIQDLDPLLDKVFLRLGEGCSELVPPYWKDFCSHMNDPEWSTNEEQKIGDENKRKGVGWTPPTPMHRPEPGYSNAARGARIKGVVVLAAAIDQFGRVEDVMLLRPIGMGLDESAVETVKRWTFGPAYLGGVPTAMRIVIEISFRLH